MKAPQLQTRYAREKASQQSGVSATARIRARRPADNRAESSAEPHAAAASVIAKTRSSWTGEFDRFLPLESVIGVGHGYAALTRDSIPVYEENGQEFEALMTVAQAEKLALADPEHEWEIHLVALLDERHYRRDGDGRWTLTSRGYGLS